MKNLVFTFAFFIGAQAWAVPTLYNSCKDIKITPVPNGNGVFLSQDCQTAYVLPPLTGTVAIDGMAPTMNMKRCPVLNSYLSIMKSQAERLEKLSKRLDGSGASPGSPIGGGSTLFPGKPADGGGSAGSTAELEKEILDTKKLFADINDTVKEYWEMEGTYGTANFTSDQQALVAAYQEKNPGISFVAMPISIAKLYLLRKTSQNTASLPAVISFDVPGSAIPIAVYPKTETPAEDGGVIFGGALTGQMVLSLVGACPYYDVKNDRMITEHLTGKDLSKYMAANVSYAYNLSVNRAYTAKYNLASFFRRLETSESKGGFFSSKTINRLIVEKNSKDWFEFKSNVEDGRHDFDQSLEATVKAELIDRVFKQINLLAVGPGEQAPGLSTPNPNGAEVGAKNLRKCPYVYCQVGAAVLDIANAIFGSSSSVSEFIQKNDFWAVDDVSESKALPFLGTVNFESK